MLFLKFQLCDETCLCLYMLLKSHNSIFVLIISEENAKLRVSGNLTLDGLCIH